MSGFMQNWLLRRAMSAPRGGEEKMWERVQYLLPAGFSRNGIDLGISPTANMNVEMHLIDFDPWDSSGFFLNSSNQTSTARFFLWANNNGSEAYCRGGYGNSSNIDNTFLWRDYQFGHETILERRGSSMYLDGVSQQTSAGTFTADPNTTLVVGDSINNSDGCYHAKYAEVIVRAEYGGSIIAHFIPVKILKEGLIDQQGESIAVGVGCYYDLVTKQFYTATYGSDFIAGPAVPKEYIWFADPVVEAICVANFSSDGIGVTMADAAAVTSLGNVFSGNTSITAFTELIYFTGLTDVSVWEFTGCDNLTKIGFPPNAGMFNLRFVPIEEMVVSNLAGYLTRTYASMDSSPGIHLFSGEGGEITRIVIPQSISHISGAALAKHKWIEDISIHSMITNIGNSAFGSCNALLSLTVPGIASIPDALCDSCSSLSLLTIGEGAETIGNSVARYTNTIVVDLPSTITSIGNTAFAGDGDLTLLIKATNPPSIATNAFNIRRSVTIYVPYSADHSILDAYKAASGWSTYASQIYELNPDGTIPS